MPDIGLFLWIGSTIFLCVKWDLHLDLRPTPVCGWTFWSYYPGQKNETATQAKLWSVHAREREHAPVPRCARVSQYFCQGSSIVLGTNTMVLCVCVQLVFKAFAYPSHWHAHQPTRRNQYKKGGGGGCKTRNRASKGFNSVDPEDVEVQRTSSICIEQSQEKKKKSKTKIVRQTPENTQGRFFLRSIILCSFFIYFLLLTIANNIKQVHRE